MINRIKWQLVLALFWFFSAYLAVSALFPGVWAWRCAWLNVIIGMIGLLWVTQTERGDRIFYQGPRKDEPGLFLAGLLWAIPITGFFIASLWWIMRLLELIDW